MGREAHSTGFDVRLPLNISNSVTSTKNGERLESGRRTMMPLLDENTHVFIIRMWLEPREIAGAAPEWRGMIEHVTSGERQYVKSLDEATEFIAGFLQRMGVKIGLRARLRRWFKRSGLKR